MFCRHKFMIQQNVISQEKVSQTLLLIISGILYDSIHTNATKEVTSKCKMHKVWLLMIKFGHLRTILLVAICNSWSYFMAFHKKNKTEQKHETVFFCSFDGIFFHSQMFNTEFYAESRTFHFMFDDSVEIEIASGYFQRVLEDEIDFCWNNS